MPRRRKPDAVYLRWDELTRRLDREGPTPEVQAEWEAWYQETAAGEGLAALHPDQAQLVLWLGARIAAAVGDRPRAIALLRAYLSHPRIDEADPTSRAHLSCDVACHLLAMGEVTEAVPLLRSLLESGDRKLVRDGRWLMRIFLIGFCLDQEESQPAPPALVSLVEHLVQHWRPAVMRRLREGATFRQVADRIDRTYPPERRRLGPADG